MGMKKNIVSHQRNKCIGCGSCSLLASMNWKMNDEDGKSDLIGGEVKKNGTVVSVINEEDLEANREASEACPVQCIRINR